MKTVVPHGHLKEIIPEGVSLEANSVMELLNGLRRQYPSMEAAPNKERTPVQVLGFDTVESLYEPTDQEEIHIVPYFGGEKENGGLIQVALGAIIIAASFIPGGQYVSIAGLKVSTSSIALFGASIALGGVMQLLSPSPEMDTGVGDRDDGSDILGAPKNTVKLGTRIPILYGERRVYGHYISFNIDAKEVTAPGDDVEAAVEPPPKPTSINVSGVNTYSSEVTIDWGIPSDSTINNFSYSDHLGNTISPFDSGTTHITRVVVTAWPKTDSRMDIINNPKPITLRDEKFEGQTSITFPEYKLYSGVYKFGVHFVYDNGESSEILKDSWEYSFAPTPPK